MAKITIETKERRFPEADVERIFQIVLRTYALLEENEHWTGRVQLIKAVLKKESPSIGSTTAYSEVEFQVIWLLPPFPSPSSLCQPITEEIKVNMSWSALFERIKVIIEKPLWVRIGEIKASGTFVDSFPELLIRGLSMALRWYRVSLENLAEKELGELLEALSFAYTEA